VTPRRERSGWLTEIWSALAATSGIGYVATAYAVSRWLTRPSPGEPAAPPAAAGLLCEDLECRTEDGLRLTGWLIAPPEPCGTVALFHGLRGNRGKMLERIAFLAGAGYRCVAFDHRGHGQSDGRCTSFGFHESRDVSAVVRLIDRRWPSQPRAALGISMGAAAVCFAAGKARPWNAFILESLYHDLASAFQTRVGCSYPRWFQRFSRGVIWVTERRLRLRLPELAPIRHVANLAPAPVLLLTGSEDPHAPPVDVRKLFENCREPRELLVIPGADHEDVCEKGGADYRQRVLDFLKRHLM
jgi:alpha-beta hydrolase superfamily lysophospholipase